MNWGLDKIAKLFSRPYFEMHFLEWKVLLKTITWTNDDKD